MTSASSLLVPAAGLVYPQQPWTTSMWVNIATTAFVALMTVFWLTRWPTRRQSQAVMVSGMMCVGGFALVQPSASVAAQAPAALAVTGVYIAFLHGTRLLLLNTALAIATTTIGAVRLAAESEVAAAAATFWLVFFLTTAVPVAIRGLSQAMGSYAMRAEVDPLTGLLNRRGFANAIDLHLTEVSSRHLIMVLLVDLDDFKRINDTRGHTMGDEVLIAVAGLLRRHTPPGAVICRAGGEEFLIALISVTADATSIATRLCIAIAGLSYQLTASIGTACTELSHSHDARAIDELIRSADTAMYSAKRQGGNQTQHA